MCIWVPKKDSKVALQRFSESMKGMIDFKCEGNNIKKRKHIYSAVSVLEKEDAVTFLEVARDKGYTSAKTPKISAEYWSAMSAESNITVTQQRVLRRYLNHHFGSRICVSEKNVSNIGNDYISFEDGSIEVDPKEYRCKRISFYWRDLCKLIEKNKEDILERFGNIGSIEILLGGDDDKDLMTFMTIVIVSNCFCFCY